METRKQRALLAASVAGILAALTSGAVGVQGAGAHEDADEKTTACYGINKCAGTGDCGGKGYSCAGKNGCKGQGFIELDKDTCLRIEGGRLTVDPEAS
ncbi:MAG: hypothetical protein Q8R78_01025 [Candidatus Omnitrophota bacterium]|nr:hypothetical protein [Candidatus Omnitrophota bacterium]